MATVETVTGAIEADELGTTLIHEHLRTRDEAVHEQWPQAKAAGGIPEREQPGDGYEAAIEAATAAVELGVKSIVGRLPVGGRRRRDVRGRPTRLRAARPRPRHAAHLGGPADGGGHG